MRFPDAAFEIEDGEDLSITEGRRRHVTWIIARCVLAVVEHEHEEWRYYCETVLDQTSAQQLRSHPLPI